MLRKYQHLSQILTCLALIAIGIADSASAPSSLLDAFVPSGEIPGAHCNIEDLEIANDSQLYSILSELKKTAFFRSFVVDLDERCPLRNFGKSNITPEAKEDNKEETTSIPPPDEETCASDGLPDLDPDAEPACHVEEGDLFSSSSSMSGTSEESKTVDDSMSTSGDSLETDEDDFECDGGDDLDLDEDEEPLCTLKEEDYTLPFKSLISMALESIRYFGWESDSQRKTYTWTTKTDPIVQSTDDMTCDENGQLPDAFWHDMCSSISNKGGKVANLVLNPERNTGYNGTHIWNAIYEENCLADKEMCLEERILYRLLSGLHTSTTLSIAKHYYPPSKRKNRVNWEANPSYFMEQFEEHPEYLRNLHFSYVVLLRALRKASKFLYDYDITTGNIIEDETASQLLKRLLDSTILQSCQPVFSAFDENIMFAESPMGERGILQRSFKGVFHNVSSILDCVQCQQCKLHGKMAMLGYGAALKILFMKNEESFVSLDRNEVVAFINTIAKFSEGLKEVRDLTNLYWKEVSPAPAVNEKEIDLVDTAVGLVSKLSREGRLEAKREMELVELALSKEPNFLLIVKHYHRDLDKFLQLIESLFQSENSDNPDAIIVGSGLAGFAAALNILDRGGTVTIVEKEHLLGGNSNKASSGINSCCPNGNDFGDILEAFKNDTIRSAGEAARPDLIDTLIRNSESALSWLKDRVGVDLSRLAQLGGHSYKRTHRPSNGMAGAEIIYGIQKAVKAYVKEGKASIFVDTKVTNLITDEKTGRVIGVSAETLDGEKKTLQATNIVLTTGGFAADRSSGSYLEKYRPELLNMPATAGAFSTGDGVTLAKALGAGTVDMDKVQLHPTGWVDPNDPDKKSKILAAELMRGVGGILINSDGERFCNELGTRAYVTNAMLSHNQHFSETGLWDISAQIPTFSLVLASEAARDGDKHVDLYTHKGLLKRIEGLNGLAQWMNVDIEALRATYNSYLNSSSVGHDEFGKVSFRGLPNANLDDEVFYAGTVTPVLHYCMGGITIDAEGSVLNQDGQKIPGLHAAGEVTGGVHGNNRLGGNSLLECTVFGTIVGKKLPVKERTYKSTLSQQPEVSESKKNDREISVEELEEHNEEGDCWVAIHGKVYDLTEFVEEHPGGAESVHVLAGDDGSEAFAAAHSEDVLEDFEDEYLGVLVTSQ